VLTGLANRLNIFERKIIRNIYGAANEERRWRIQNNSEIEQILENENMVNFFKVRQDQMVGPCGKNEQGKNS